MMLIRNFYLSKSSFILYFVFVHFLILTIGSYESFSVSAAKVDNSFKQPVPVKYNHDEESDEYAGYDDEDDHGPFHSQQPRTSIQKLLESHGLDGITDSISEFVKLFDSSRHFFTRLNTDETFEVLNRVVYSFAKSFNTVFGAISSGAGTPTGPLSFTQMKDLLEKQESTLKGLLIKDEKILSSEWSAFIGKIHVVFDSLKNLYKLALDGGLSLNWWMINVAVLVMNKVPMDLFDRSTFSEFLGIPEVFHAQVHDAMLSLFKSDFAPFVQIIAGALGNYQRQKHQEQRESEL